MFGFSTTHAATVARRWAWCLGAALLTWPSGQAAASAIGQSGFSPTNAGADRVVVPIEVRGSGSLRPSVALQDRDTSAMADGQCCRLRMQTDAKRLLRGSATRQVASVERIRRQQDLGTDQEFLWGHAGAGDPGSLWEKDHSSTAPGSSSISVAATFEEIIVAHISEPLLGLLGEEVERACDKELVVVGGRAASRRLTMTINPRDELISTLASSSRLSGDNAAFAHLALIVSLAGTGASGIDALESNLPRSPAAPPVGVLAGCDAHARSVTANVQLGFPVPEAPESWERASASSACSGWSTGCCGVRQHHATP